jgi:hypothetical protein
MIECTICGRSFETYRSMTNHRRWHPIPKYMSFQKKVSKAVSLASIGNRHGEANAMEKNGRWRGQYVGYKAIHDWVKYHKPKSPDCDKCHKNKPLDLANKSGLYRRDLRDWEWLCRRCHLISDGRMEKLRNAKILSQLRKSSPRT